MEATKPDYAPAAMPKKPNDPNYQAMETPMTPVLPQFIVREGAVDTSVTHDGDMGRLGLYK